MMITRIFKWLSFNIRYFWDAPWDTGITPPEVFKFIENTQPGRALDLGAGTGTNIITLAKAGWDAVGVEYALVAIITAKLKIKRERVDAKVFMHEVTELDFLTGSFDLVLDIGCFHSLEPEERREYRNNLPALLNPGGTFLLYSFLSTEPDHPVGISEEEIVYFSQILQKISAVRGTEREKLGSIWLEFRKK